MAPAQKYDYDPRNLPQEALAAIGLCVACSATAESSIEMAIGGCLGLDFELTIALTTHMTMPLRFDTLRSVAELRIDDLDDLDQLDTLLDNLKIAFDKRNAVAHNTWLIDRETKGLLYSKFSSRGTLNFDLIPMDVAQIKQDAQTIYAAGMELIIFLRAKGLFPHYPTVQRPREHKTEAARKKRRESLARK